MTAYLWDIAAAVAIGVCAIVAYRRGFLNTVVRLAGTLVAVIVSLTYSKPVAAAIYHNYLEDHILKIVGENIERFTQPGLEAFAEAINGLIDQMPVFLSGALRLQSEANTETWYQGITGVQTDLISVTVTETVVTPVAIALIQAIVFGVMFAGLIIAVTFLAKLLRGVNRIPLIGGVNALLGGVLGAAQGLLFVFVAATALDFMMNATGDTLSFISHKMIAETIFFRYFFIL